MGTHSQRTRLGPPSASLEQRHARALPSSGIPHAGHSAMFSPSDGSIVVGPAFGHAALERQPLPLVPSLPLPRKTACTAMRIPYPALLGVIRRPDSPALDALPITALDTGNVSPALCTARVNACACTSYAALAVQRLQRISPPG